MKKVITIALLVVTLFAGGMTAEAKTTKKKSTTTKTTQTSSAQWNGDIPSASLIYKSFLPDPNSDFKNFEKYGYNLINNGSEVELINPGVCKIYCSYGSHGGTVYVTVYDSSKRNKLYQEVKSFFSKKIEGQLYLHELNGDTISIFW